MGTSLLMSKILDISLARGRSDTRQQVIGMQEEEKRTQCRSTTCERVFLQIVSGEDPHLIGTTMSCSTIDVSGSGIEFQARVPIPIGSQLDLWVDDSSGPGKFFLSSAVRWQEQVGDGWHVGVELFDGAATDIKEWRKLHG